MEIRFQTVEGDFRIRLVSKAKSILVVCLSILRDWGLTLDFIMIFVPKIQIHISFWAENVTSSINKKKERNVKF